MATLLTLTPEARSEIEEFFGQTLTDFTILRELDDIERFDIEYGCEGEAEVELTVELQPELVTSLESPLFGEAELTEGLYGQNINVYAIQISCLEWAEKFGALYILVDADDFSKFNLATEASSFLDGLWGILLQSLTSL